MRDDPIDATCAAYREAVRAKDVDALVALYAPEVRVFDLWGAWAYTGRDAWRRAIDAWFASLGDERVDVDFAEIGTTVIGDAALAQAFVTYRAIAPDGTSLRAMQNRLSWMLVRADGRWTIVHEHTSAPVDPDTGKAILQR